MGEVGVLVCNWSKPAVEEAALLWKNALGAVTVKVTPLLGMLFTVITTLPVVPFDGTVAITAVLLQLLTVAATPLNVMVLVPWLAPNALPLIVTVVPGGPELGDKLLMLDVAVKNKKLLAAPFTVTTTGDDPGPRPAGTVTAMLPLLQLLTVAAIPAKVTELVPWLAPKFDPVIVIAVPTGPEISDRLLMTGVTVNVATLLAKPFTVTATFAVPGDILGTLKPMPVLLQLEGAIVLPPKLKLLDP